MANRTQPYCYKPWCGLEKLCIDCAQAKDEVADEPVEKRVKVILNLDVYHDQDRTTIWTSEVWEGEMQAGDNNCDPLMLQKQGGLEDGHQIFRLLSLDRGIATYRPVTVARVGWFYRDLKNWGFKRREPAPDSNSNLLNDSQLIASMILGLDCPPLVAFLEFSNALNFMRETGSSVQLNWGEDNNLWELSWITGGKRITALSKDKVLAVKYALVDAEARIRTKLSDDKVPQITDN
ncbi:MAG: hypothetical protein WBV94_25110 [Blastocatellia bacterium]